MLSSIFRKFRFHLNETQSPTYFNLVKYLQLTGWTNTRFTWRAHFSEKQFEFDTAAATCLEYKNLLANLVADYCPEIMPVTYCIDDSNWPSILSEIAEAYYTKENYLTDYVKNLSWILKPALLNNGKDIKIFEKLTDIEAHYLSANRLGGPHVLQRYISNPHLLNGYKYSIRMFVVFTNYAGVYLYQQGYFNVALLPYQSSQYSDLRSHLTNEHLKDPETNVIQVPCLRMEIYPQLEPQIIKILFDAANAVQQKFPSAFVCQKNRALAIFGFDFMVDSDMRVWLLEANHGPCFPVSDDHPLQKNLYADFWRDFIKSFVMPIAKKQSPEKIQYLSFRKII